MKCAAIFVAALSFGTALSAVLQAREPEAESVRLATGAEVSDTETGLSVRRRDTGELTSVSPSGPEDRSGDGGLEKRWSKSCVSNVDTPESVTSAYIVLARMHSSMHGSSWAKSLGSRPDLSSARFSPFVQHVGSFSALMISP